MSFRNILIFVTIAIVATYVFIAVNERQKEKLIRMRLPKFRKIAKYEFDKSLGQVRTTRTARNIGNKTVRITERNFYEKDPREDFYKDYEYIENLRNEPATEAQPIQDPYTTDQQPQTQQYYYDQQQQQEETQEQQQQRYRYPTRQQQWQQQQVEQ